MDRREQNHRWYGSFDRKRMIFLVELTNGLGEPEFHELPAKFEVCETCEGKGTHVNPSIDGNGLSSEDFDEDPDFREDYFSGRYDVRCAECNGDRVSPAVDMDALEPEIRKLVDKHIRDFDQDQREQEAERRMGY